MACLYPCWQFSVIMPLPTIARLYSRTRCEWLVSFSASLFCSSLHCCLTDASNFSIFLHRCCTIWTGVIQNTCWNCWHIFQCVYIFTCSRARQQPTQQRKLSLTCGLCNNVFERLFLLSYANEMLSLALWTTKLYSPKGRFGIRGLSSFSNEAGVSFYFSILTADDLLSLGSSSCLSWQLASKQLMLARQDTLSSSCRCLLIVFSVSTKSLCLRWPASIILEDCRCEYWDCSIFGLQYFLVLELHIFMYIFLGSFLRVGVSYFLTAWGRGSGMLYSSQMPLTQSRIRVLLLFIASLEQSKS